MGSWVWLSGHQEVGGGAVSNLKVLHIFPAQPRLCAASSIAASPLPLPPPNHKHPGANGERPDGEHFNVIYLFIRKHEFAFLFNWLSDLWEFDCQWSTALIG